MKSSAARCRRLRERAREGKIMLTIEVDQLDLTELLVRAGLLEQWHDQDRDEIARATEKLLITLAAETET